jgi:hypothetical protein
MAVGFAVIAQNSCMINTSHQLSNK